MAGIDIVEDVGDSTEGETDASSSGSEAGNTALSFTNVDEAEDPPSLLQRLPRRLVFAVGYFAGAASVAGASVLAYLLYLA